MAKRTIIFSLYTVVWLGLTLAAVADVIPNGYTREQARHFVLDTYCKLDCAGYLDTGSPRYRRVMARALDGKFRPLCQVFFKRDFHSGDNESWENIPGQILYVVGDKRFAKFLSRLSPEYQRNALNYVQNAGFFWVARETGDKNLFHRRFPLTYRHYVRFWPQYADN